MELMSAKIFNGEIERYFGGALRDIGFDTIKENLWVQDVGIGIRKVVIIRHWKGAESTPCWGYSIDYVPHFDTSYQNIYWHRTNKSAMMDVFPLYFDFFKYTFSRFAQPQAHSKYLQDRTPKMLLDLEAFYGVGCKTADLLSILKKCESYRSSGLGFWNWVQLPLAYAFVLNKSGEYEKAQEILEQYMNRSNITLKAKQKLIERFHAVRA